MPSLESCWYLLAVISRYFVCLLRGLICLSLVGLVVCMCVLCVYVYTYVYVFLCMFVYV